MSTCSGLFTWLYSCFCRFINILCRRSTNKVLLKIDNTVLIPRFAISLCEILDVMWEKDGMRYPFYCTQTSNINLGTEDIAV